MIDRGDSWSRREFVCGLGGVGAITLAGGGALAAELPPEIRTLRLVHDPEVPTLCYAPLYVAEKLLRGEGFTDIRYVKPVEGSEAKTLGVGLADISGVLAATLVLAVEQRQPLVALAGLHIGCLEVVARPGVRAIRDLKGRTVAVSALDSDDHVFLAGVLAYVGLDPRRDVKWITPAPDEAARMLTAGRVDAIVAFPPFAQELRARRIGEVIVRSTTDRPWSHYFCCMFAANRDFVRRSPVATKRALRAVLKANRLCAQDPAKTARWLVERRFATRYASALQTLKEIPYAAWRDHDPESTLTFYALRLRDARLIKSAPRKIVADGADWRFLKELKLELKA